MLPTVDPFLMMILNVVGTIGFTILSSIMGAFASEFIAPLFESIGTSLGFTSAV